MNANFVPAGSFCKSRIYLTDCSHADGGIRHHSWLTALFLKCLNKITEVRHTDGRILYLNKGSFDAWKARHQKEFPEAAHPHVYSPNPADAINAICAAHGKRAAGAMLEREPGTPEYAEGLRLLRNAAQIDQHQKEAFEEQAKYLETIQSEWKTNPPSDQLKQSLQTLIKEWNSVIEEFRKKSYLKSSSMRLIMYFAKSSLLEDMKRLFEGFLKDGNADSLFNVLGSEKWNVSAGELGIGDQRDIRVLSNPVLEELFKKAPPDTLEKRRAQELQKRHQLVVLSGICQKIKTGTAAILQRAMERDEKQINEVADHYKAKADEAIAKNDLSEAETLLTNAERIHLSPEKRRDIAARLNVIRNLNRWNKENPAKAALKDELLSKLENWLKAFGVNNKQGEAKEIHAVYQDICTQLKTFVEKDDFAVEDFLTFLTKRLKLDTERYERPATLLYKLGVYQIDDLTNRTLKDMRSDLDKLGYQGKALTNPSMRQYALVELSKRIDDMHKKSVAHLKSAEFEESANVALRKSDLGTAEKMLTQAKEANSYDSSLSLADRIKLIKAIVKFCSDHKINILDIAQQRKELQAKLTENVTKWKALGIKTQGIKGFYGGNNDHALMEIQKIFEKYVQDFRPSAYSWSGYLDQLNIRYQFPQLDPALRFAVPTSAPEKWIADDVQTFVRLKEMNELCTQLFAQATALSKVEASRTKVDEALAQGDLKKAQSLLEEALRDPTDFEFGMKTAKKIQNEKKALLDQLAQWMAKNAASEEDLRQAAIDAGTKLKEIDEKVKELQYIHHHEDVRLVKHMMPLLKSCLVDDDKLRQNLRDFRMLFEQLMPSEKLSLDNPVLLGIKASCKGFADAIITKCENDHIRRMLPQLYAKVCEYVVNLNETDIAFSAGKALLKCAQLEVAQLTLQDARNKTKSISARASIDKELQEVIRLVTWKQVLAKDSATFDDVVKFSNSPEAGQKMLTELQEKLSTAQKTINADHPQIPNLQHYLRAVNALIEGLLNSIKNGKELSPEFVESQVSALLRGNPYSIKDLTSFTFDGWKAKIAKLQGISCSGATQEAQQKLIRGYNLVLMRQFIDDFLSGSAGRIRFVEVSEGIRYDFETSRYDEWMQILSGDRSSFKIDTTTLKAYLQHMRTAIFAETEYMLKNPPVWSHDSMAYLKNIAVLISSAPSFHEGYSIDIVLDGGQHRVFKEKMAAWDRLSGAAQNSEAGYKVKREAIKAFLHLWLCYAQKIVLVIAQRQAVAQRVREQSVRLVAY